MANKDEGDFAVYEAVDLREENDGDDDQGIRAWQCSICQIVQPIEIDPCQECNHPRDPAPESDDVIIINWHPNEGEMDMMVDDPDVFNEEPGAAAPAMDSIDVVRQEGEGVESSSDWGDDDDDEDADDWADTELVDPNEQPIMLPRERLDEGAEPSNPDKGWICGACNRENSIMDLECCGCGKTRNMRRDGIDDVILLRAEVTAGMRPNREPEQKDLEIVHEVWPCTACSWFNDYNPENLVCSRCNHVPDSTKGELVSFSMADEEYQNLVGGPRKEKDRAAGSGAGGGGGGHFGVGGGQPFVPSNKNNRAKRKDPKQPQVRNLRQLGKNDFTDTPAVVRRNARPDKYPIRSDLGFKDPNRLGKHLGAPQPMPCFATRKSFWRDGTIAFPCLRIREILEEVNPHGGIGLADRGFDVNEEGCLAVLSGRKLRVYRPLGPSFELRIEIPFDMETKSEHRLRVRYRRNIVYVFCDYRIQRFHVDPQISCDINRLDDFSDDYMKDQKFQDVDVGNDFVVSVWRKWAGLYKANNFAWFHAVSTSNVVINPKSMAFNNAYLHITMGSSLLAFHVSSRDPTVLWVNGNLPQNDDVPFCVSRRYGVFTAVYGDILQSYYDALTAQCVYGPSCGKNGISATPAPSERRQSRHLFHNLLCGPGLNPFGEVGHIEYDESFGENGRLLCWDAKSGILFMGLNREEFDPLEIAFRGVFELKEDQNEDGGDFAAVHDAANRNDEQIPPFGLLDLNAMRSLTLNDRVDYRCGDGRYRVGTVRASGGGLIVLGFEDPDVEVERVENAEDFIDRFALEGEVTRRSGRRLEDVDVDSEVSVNLNNVGWTLATVVEVDEHRGQVAVRLGNGEVRWTHLDFENEIRHRVIAVAEASEFVAAESTPGGSATEGKPNLMEDLSPEQTNEIETIYVAFSNKYSESVVKWFLLMAVKLDVQSSPTGMTVSRA